MKKILSLALAALMLVSCIACFASCGDSIKGVKVIEIKLSEEEYAFAVQKGDTELLTKLNAFMAEIKANGKFDEIVNKYFGDGTPTAVTSASEMKTDGSQLIVATNAAFAPFEYKDGDKFAGIDMEIAAYIAEKLGMELVIMDMEFDSVVSSVGKNGVDVAMAGLTVNETRKEFVNFTSTYYNAAQMLVVPADNTDFDACKTAEDVLAVLAEQAK